MAQVLAEAQVPLPAPGQRAVLELSYCPTCRAVGEVRAYEEQNAGDYDRFVRGTDPVAIGADAIAAATAVIKHRTPDAVL